MPILDSSFRVVISSTPFTCDNQCMFWGNFDSFYFVQLHITLMVSVSASLQPPCCSCWVQVRFSSLTLTPSHQQILAVHGTESCSHWAKYANLRL
jgi:hypothetical protein